VGTREEEKQKQNCPREAFFQETVSLEVGRCSISQSGGA
jgi:hypothetical protein